MGMKDAPAKCFLTDNDTQNQTSAIDSIDYSVRFSGKNHMFRFYSDHENSEFVESKKYILKGLLINGLFPFKRWDYINNEFLEKIINEASIPKSPREKLDNLILTLFEMQTCDGGKIDVKKNNPIWAEFIYKLYFKNHTEYWFYLNSLKTKGLVDFVELANKEMGPDTNFIRFTFLGLDYVMEIQDDGENSKRCFIAMSFGDGMDNIRLSIKNACEKTGYPNPIIIDEIQIDSHVTINDAIISNIRKSKFCIADFTEQRDGVYFESGFALGLGKKVIYTCRRDWFDKTHFDINHFPHIIYDNNEELERKLVDKIMAWVL